MNCHGCQCDHCVYSAELESWYFTPGEVQQVEEICYCCDECRYYDGDLSKRSQRRTECDKHKFPVKYEIQRMAAAEREARRRRASFRVIRGDDFDKTDNKR